MTGEAIACTRAQMLLGEGLRWDVRREELLAVDILAGCVYRGRVADDGGVSLIREYEVPGTVGAVAPVHGDDGWLLAAGRGFVHLSQDGSVHTIAEVAPEGTRMNDGACDPRGRFWAGTLADDFRPGAGALYRLERDGRIEVMLEELTISNGIGWSPDGGSMYYIDSTTQRVVEYDYDLETGELGAQSVFADIETTDGLPDGLTVDADGGVWVCLFGGGRIRRYRPDGSLDREIVLPLTNPTCPAFGGADLGTLYITTARHRLTEDQLAREPLAGAVLQLRPGELGVAPYRFSG